MEALSELVRLGKVTPAQVLFIEGLRACAPLLAALVAAGIAAWVAHKFGRIQEGIARQQAETAAAAAKTARNKLKLDLFDRRLVVYEAATAFITQALANGRSQNSAEHDFWTGIQGRRWLFDAKIVEYLEKEVWNDVVELHALTVELDGPVAGQDRMKLAQDRSAQFKKVIQQRTIIDEKFAPYLHLET